MIDMLGTVCWYCPWRFDQPSLFSLLIDAAGGYWSVQAAGMQLQKRHYTEDSAVLLSTFAVAGGHFTVTDFMPAGQYTGLCRLFSPSPVTVVTAIFPTPNYGRATAVLRKGKDNQTIINNQFHFYIKASHPIVMSEGKMEITIPAGEKGWCVVMDDKAVLPHIDLSLLESWLQAAVQYWKQIMGNIHYQGAYQKEFYQSYKAIQLVRHAQSGGILAAATTSLPEVVGDERNYDYRYIWLRDTAMDVTALVKGGSRGNEAERFLDFLCLGRHTNKKNLFVPFYDLDAKTAPFESFIPGTGYQASTPLRIGNNANEQLQLDAQGNVILAAVEVYQKTKERPHWKVIAATADYLVRHWHKKDHGIWEEGVQEHFTSSKVLAATSLEWLAPYTNDTGQKMTWLRTAQKIRAFINQYCKTAYGAYAVYAGSQEADIAAALFPVWKFDQPNSEAMQRTIQRLEEVYREGDLYHRHLVETDSAKEGVFLAGSLWMAQYYLLTNKLQAAKTIVDAVLAYSTDLGFISEEGDVPTGSMLGNIPQTFVHASLMSVILDYNKAVNGK